MSRLARAAGSCSCFRSHTCRASGATGPWRVAVLRSPVPSVPAVIRFLSRRPSSPEGLYW
ncbi:MAG: hypothetical protein WBA23_14800 [Tunicatimonas sp.]